MNESPGAGWYPDPSDKKYLRWWGGEAWSEHRKRLSENSALKKSSKKNPPVVFIEDESSPSTCPKCGGTDYRPGQTIVDGTPCKVKFCISCNEKLLPLAVSADSRANSNRASAVRPTGSAAIVCPFCQQRGSVNIRYKEDIGSITKLGRSLLTAGLLSSRRKYLQCRNCNQEWDMGSVRPFDI